MMGAISHKLRSQRGASMLLALLFLLICSMVTASILMAAVANAGKHRSNLTEHQTYLALSSAVSTLCDELNRCEYRGQYCYWETTQTTTDPDTGTEISETIRHFKQLEGSYTYIGTDTDGSLKEVLLRDFDAIFAKAISLPSGVIDEGRKTGSLIPHALTLTPETGISDVDKRINITLEVKDSYAIYITAYLEGLEVYKVEAELTPSANAPTLPLSLSNQGETVTQQTDPMQWKLGWITIFDEEEGGAAGA